MPWNHEESTSMLARRGRQFWEELLDHPSITKVVRRLARGVVRRERAGWERDRTRTIATQRSETRNIGVQTEWIGDDSIFEITDSESNYNWTMEGPSTWSTSPSPDYAPVPCVTIN